MTTGFDHHYVETHDWGKAMAFWQRLGFEVEFETGHGSGMLRHPSGGPAVFIAEQSIEDPLATEMYLGAGADYEIPRRRRGRQPIHRNSLGNQGDGDPGSRWSSLSDPGTRRRVNSGAGRHDSGNLTACQSFARLPSWKRCTTRR